MGIKYDEKTKSYSVSYHKRHPITKLPVRAARIGIKSMAEAKRVFTELVIQVEQKLHRLIVPLWWELVLLYLTSAVESGKMTEKTAENYQINLRAYTFEDWEKRSVDTITTQEVRELIKRRVGDKSPTTQKNALKFIRGTFKHGVELGVINRDPCPSMKFQAGDKIKKVLTEPQARLLLSKGKEYDWEWHPHTTMATYTGMRNGELYALTWDKVNLDERTILVDTSWNNKDGFKSTKSGDDRMVEIAENLVPLLAELKLKNPDSVYVLPRNSQWDEGRQAAALQMFCVALGLPKIRFHDLRATWATLMLSKGVEPAKLMVMGGWKDMKTLMIYMRKAGISIKGITACLDLHDPSPGLGKLLKIGKRSNS